ncbi:MAG: YHS domain-containing protein [Betaproteobacteria bacterium]|nr:YHS domain-containing protein [Betaproteobacteria bacterium]
MDAEGLKSLGWLLLWGGLFFVMMRYGCGAHMMGGRGHGGHGGHGDATTGGDAKDPVCGMLVDSQKAAAAAVRGGKTYYFCSTSCRDKFEQAPDQYIGASTQGGQQHGGHHHG